MRAARTVLLTAYQKAVLKVLRMVVWKVAEWEFQ